MPLDKPSDMVPGGAVPIADRGRLFRADFPCLWEYMYSDAWADGSPRETSSLSIFVGDGVLKACLSDRARDRTAWSAGETVNDLLASFELKLQSESVEWRKGASSKRKK